MSESLRLARPLTLTQMAASKLRDAIISGQFQPGQRLVELELSDSFGVSRAPLREAFRILAGEGLVDIRQNRGCTVVNPSTEELEQMVFFRSLIEGAAAGLITSLRDPAKLDLLEAARQRMISTSRIKDNMPFLEAHWVFHSSIIFHSGNLFLVDSWNRIGTMFRIFMGKTFVRLGDRAETLNTIDGFLRYFRNGTPEKAEALVRSVILWSGFRLLDTTIPNAVASYVTHEVGPGAQVVAIEPERLAARLRLPPAPRPAATGPRAKKRQGPAGRQA
jgi:DNA-binding GntR family transcriptional regulator